MPSLKGEVWLVNLDIGTGHEQYGIRPAIMVGRNVNGMTIIIPLTSNLNRANFPYTQIIHPNNGNGLDQESVALIFQLRSIDNSSLIRKIGKINSTEIETIDTQVKDILYY